MTDDFLGAFMGSMPRAKVLRVFMFDPGVLTLPQVVKRSGTSAQAAAKEIKTLEKWGVIRKGKFSITLGNGEKRLIAGKQKEEAWTANTEFKHAGALSKFIHEVSPAQHKHILGALRQGGRITVVVLSGAFMGDLSRPADLIVAADSLNEGRLEAAVKGLEPQFGREIRYAAFSTPEFRYRLTIQDRLLRDTLDYPHLVLVDKTRLL